MALTQLGRATRLRESGGGRKVARLWPGRRVRKSAGKPGRGREARASREARAMVVTWPMGEPGRFRNRGIALQVDASAVGRQGQTRRDRKSSKRLGRERKVRGDRELSLGLDAAVAKAAETAETAAVKAATIKATAVETAAVRRDRQTSRESQASQSFRRKGKTGNGEARKLPVRHQRGRSSGRKGSVEDNEVVSVTHCARSPMFLIGWEE